MLFISEMLRDINFFPWEKIFSDSPVEYKILRFRIERIIFPIMALEGFSPKDSKSGDNFLVPRLLAAEVPAHG